MLKIRVVKAMQRVTAAAAISLLVALSASAQTVRYTHTDALGSVVLTTDKDRNIVERSEYEPYGKLVNRPLSDGPGYAGHVADANTGLNYMQQRYMDPQLGLFLSTDPVSAYEQPVGQFNRYRYANGNPYKFMDPDGREVEYKNGPGIDERRQTLHILAISMSPSAHNELRQLEMSKEKYTIIMGKVNPWYNANTRTLYLDPNLGLRILSTGEIQPSAINSAHEIGHAAQHDRVGDKAFSDAKKDIQANGVDREENRAAMFERQVGKELGEPTRQYYRDAGEGVTCESDFSSGCK
ncbi:RHS repeat-associated protein [Xanthomonas translucens]